MEEGYRFGFAIATAGGARDAGDRPIACDLSDSNGWIIKPTVVGWITLPRAAG